MTNKYKGTSAVLAPVLSVFVVLPHWFPTFWAISHLQTTSWINRDDDAKVL